MNRKLLFRCGLALTMVLASKTSFAHAAGVDKGNIVPAKSSQVQIQTNTLSEKTQKVESETTKLLEKTQKVGSGATMLLTGNTWADNMPFLSLGDRSMYVGKLQETLNNWRRSKGETPRLICDETFGTDTRNEVIAFQAWWGIKQDGMVGPTTWAALEGYYSKS